LIRITEESRKVVSEMGKVVRRMMLMRATILEKTLAFSRSMTFAEPGISKFPVLSRQETKRVKK